MTWYRDTPWPLMPGIVGIISPAFLSLCSILTTSTMHLYSITNHTIQQNVIFVHVYNIMGCMLLISNELEGVWEGGRGIWVINDGKLVRDDLITRSDTLSCHGLYMRDKLTMEIATGVVPIVAPVTM